MNPVAAATTQDGSTSSATMAGVPSLPSYSSAGPSTSMDPPSDPTSSGSQDPSSHTMSADSHASWPDMGPHNIGDVVDPIFEELYSFNNLVKLRHAQWFLPHFLIRHESLSHQLLIVSVIDFSVFQNQFYFQMQYFCLFVANSYFPQSELPELYMLYRIMVSSSSSRQLQKNMILFANDLEYWVQEHVDEDTDETLFIPLYGKQLFQKSLIRIILIVQVTTPVIYPSLVSHIPLLYIFEII